jgi:hypothetical protein
MESMQGELSNNKHFSSLRLCRFCWVAKQLAQEAPGSLSTEPQRNRQVKKALPKCGKRLCRKGIKERGFVGSTVVEMVLVSKQRATPRTSSEWRCCSWFQKRLQWLPPQPSMVSW